MKTRKRIPVKIVENNTICRFTCDVCGGLQGKSSRLAVFTLDDHEGEQIICENCMIAGEAGIEDRLLAKAEALEAHAAEMRDRATSYQIVLPPDEILEEAFPGFSSFREFGAAPV